MVNMYIFYHGRKVLGSQNISFIMRIWVEINNVTWKTALWDMGAVLKKQKVYSGVCVYERI